MFIKIVLYLNNLVCCFFRPLGLAPAISGLLHQDHFHLVNKEPNGYGYSMIRAMKQMKPASQPASQRNDHG